MTYAVIVEWMDKPEREQFDQLLSRRPRGSRADPARRRSQGTNDLMRAMALGAQR